MRWLRIAALVGMVANLGACDSNQVQACETQLKDKLKSPASYKRVSLDVTQIPKSIHDPPYDEVTITYDAANSYNALLRDKEMCFFHPGTTDRFDPYGFESSGTVDMNATDMNATDLDVNAATAEATAAADAALNAADEAVQNASDAIANTNEGPIPSEEVIDNYPYDENDAGE